MTTTEERHIYEKPFVPFEIAVLLKEHGFEDADIDCMGFYERIINGEHTMGSISGFYINCIDEGVNGKYAFYITLNAMRFSFEDKNNYILAPLYQQVQDWFRDTHKIHIIVEPVKRFKKPIGYVGKILIEGKEDGFELLPFESYYEALNMIITEAIKFYI